MPKVVVLPPIVPGDDKQFLHYEEIDEGVTIVQATMTLLVTRGARVPAPGTAPKVITLTDNPGVGQIVNAGDWLEGKWQCLVRFDHPGSDTILLTPGKLYYHNVRIKTVDNRVTTPEIGTWQMLTA